MTFRDLGNQIRTCYNSLQQLINTLSDGFAEIEGGGGGGSSYSTEEHVVGTWIDGKPLYEKTIAIDNIDIGYTNEVKTKIPHGISNLKQAVSLEYSAPFFNKTGSNAVFAGTTPSILAYFIVTESDIEAAGGTNYHSGAAGRYWYFTVRYTKTTD